MRERPSQTDLPCLCEDASLFFSGPPELCRGVVRLHNPSDARLRIKRLPLRARLGAGEAAPLQLRGFTRLAARERRDLEMWVGLDPQTPPGRYEAELALTAGAHVPVTLDVLEARSTRLVPDRMSFTTRAGAKLNLCTTVWNRGNVADRIAERAVVHIVAGDQDITHHFHAAAAAVGQTGHQAFLDDFVARTGRDEPPLGRAKVVSGAGVLEPGAYRRLEVRVEVPKGLGEGRPFDARVRLGEAQLRFRLHIEGGKA